MLTANHVTSPDEKSAIEVISFARGQREWRKKATERLSGTMRDPEKMAKRASLLVEHPELRRRIDTTLLKDVVNYEVFKCHPDCSVARDQAVDGSDIDGGIVVTKEPVPPELQQEFVDRLRLMGFSCYSQAEKDGFDATDMQSLDPEKQALLRGLRIDARNELISFVTTEQVQQAIDVAKSNPVYYNETLPGSHGLDILVAGYEIKPAAVEQVFAL